MHASDPQIVKEEEKENLGQQKIEICFKRIIRQIHSRTKQNKTHSSRSHLTIRMIHLHHISDEATSFSRPFCQWIKHPINP